MAVRSWNRQSQPGLRSQGKARDFIRERYVLEMILEFQGDVVSLSPGVCQRTCRCSNASDLCVTTAPTCIRNPSTRTIYPHIPRPRRCTYLTQRAEYLGPHHSRVKDRAVPYLPQKAISHSPSPSRPARHYRLPLKNIRHLASPRPTRNLTRTRRVRPLRVVAQRVSVRRRKHAAYFL